MKQSENPPNFLDDFQSLTASAARPDVPCVSSQSQEQQDFGGVPVAAATAMIGHNGGPELTPGCDRNTSDGWINAHRAMRKHPLVGFLNEDGSRRRNAKKTCEGMAWLDLCMEAGWKPQTYNNKGKMIALLRGQFVGARAWLAARWGWSEDEVKWFLKKLERDAMITVGAGNQAEEPHRDHIATMPNQTGSNAQSNAKRRAHFANVITVCNYNIYQTAKELETLLSERSAPNQTPNRFAESAHPAPIQRPHIEEDNKEIIREDSYRLPLGADAGEVEINCVSINIPTGHAMLYEKIDAEGAKVGLAPEVVRALAANLAKGMVLRPALAHSPTVQPEQPALFALDQPGAKRRERAKPTYSPEFEAFWIAYKKHANDMEGAKGQASEEFVKLSRKDQEIAITAVPMHAAKLRKTDTKFKHACRFLKHREFDGYAQAASPEAVVNADRELQITALALDIDAKKWDLSAKFWNSKDDVPKDIVRAANQRHAAMLEAQSQPGW